MAQGYPISERQRKNIFFCIKKELISYSYFIKVNPGVRLSPVYVVDVLTRHKELCMAKLAKFMRLMR